MATALNLQTSRVHEDPYGQQATDGCDLDTVAQSKMHANTQETSEATY
jgi:hypothetical protein